MRTETAIIYSIGVGRGGGGGGGGGGAGGCATPPHPNNLREGQHTL